MHTLTLRIDTKYNTILVRILTVILSWAQYNMNDILNICQKSYQILIHMIINQ